MSDELERAFADYQKREQEERAAAKAALLALVDQLGAAGVSQVCAQFSGYGDEGSIEHVEFLDAKGESLALEDGFPNLEDTFYVLLPPGV